MGELKSVKVDNWGVFFLQKLQNFFNKTDYCDLTLQFNDNSQLKVHRLVLSACTDYFNVLENTYEMNDDTLIMPKDLQADVVVPIVNFMYTGTLEFEYNMYDRLFRTAKEMNMTVLLKLLEAHRKTAPSSKPVPVVLNKSMGSGRINLTQPKMPFSQSYPVRPVERTYSSPAQRKNTTITRTIVDKTRIMSCIPKANIPETIAIVSKYRHVESKTGPSRFDPTDEEILPDSFESFNTISYESKPLITADQIKEEEDDTSYDERPSTSTFEQLRKGYTNQNKRPAPKLTSPLPTKKPNLQDVKEYTEAHRLRKQLEAEEDTEDDPTYYDDSHFSDDDDDPLIIKKKPIKSYEKVSKSSIKTITKKPDDDSPGSKDNTGSAHHAKIISEVLKQYPHLVKNIKNIKLKIMQNPAPAKPEVPTKVVTVQKVPLPPPPPVQTKSIPAQKSQPKKIDSKTMHALIAKGAENMTGPWLCLRCGVGGRPISIPSYKSFRRHLTNVHNEKIDPRICEHCGYRSQRKTDLIYHLLNEHNIKMPAETGYLKCTYCDIIAVDAAALKKHTITMHRSKINVETIKKDVQHCIYCNKVFSKEVLLYAHMRANHKEKAREDGVMDFSDDEQSFDEADKYVPNDPLMESSDNKIKILSNISIPSRKGIPFVIDPSAQTISQIGGKSQTIVNLEPSSEAEALSNVASGIATSLGLVEEEEEEEEVNSPFHDSNQILPNQFIEQAMANVHGEFDKKDADDSSEHLLTKLVTADGAELELTASQKEEIISQLQGQNSNMSENVVMVLNQDNFDENTEIINSDQNIVVVYSQADDVIKENFIETDNEPNDPLETTQTVVEEETVEETNIDWQGEDQIVDEDIEEELNKTDEKTDDDKNDSMDKIKIENELKEESKEDPVKETKLEKINRDEDSDKLKLISALEGEWSDEEEKVKEDEKTLDSTETEVKDEVFIEAAAEDSPNQSKEFPDKEHKNLSKIMGEWDDENGKEEIKDEEELETVVKKEIIIKDEILSQEKVIEEKTNNPELKTLINDWGDDEDDGDL